MEINDVHPRFIEIVCHANKISYPVYAKIPAPLQARCAWKTEGLKTFSILEIENPTRKLIEGNAPLARFQGPRKLVRTPVNYNIDAVSLSCAFIKR
jgi:hypothetical protein